MTQVRLADQRLSAEEYLARPEGHFEQLIDGEIVVSELTLRHQEIVLFLVYELTTWCRASKGRGQAGIPVNVILDDANVFGPDVWWVAEEHRPGPGVDNLEGPPDLVVEVRSPSTWRFDIGAKRATYERYGLKELWLVDTESETVLVFRRSSPSSPEFDVALELGRGEVLTSPQLPDLSLDVAQIFDR